MDGEVVRKSRELTRLRVERHRDAKRRKKDTNVAETGGGSAVEANEPLCDSENTICNETNVDSLESGHSSTALNREWREEVEYVQTDNTCSDGSEDVDDSDATDEEPGIDDGYNEIEELRGWALRTKIPQQQLDELLGILRRRLLTDLPKSSKTFLGITSVHYAVQKIDGANNRDSGELVYFGITKYLQAMVNVTVHEEAILDLLFNIDGLPLYKSSSKQVWPILCKVYLQPDLYKPFPVAIFVGDKKPSNLEQYFHDFIFELNHLLQNGIEIDDTLFQIRIKSFICDTPARSLIKCCIGHGGYYACERCTVKGKRVARRTIYPTEDSEQNLFEKRTGESSRSQENIEHHTGVSPLLSIEPSINMVTVFSLDFMHLCCLGVMKKMFMHFWLNKKSASQLSENNKLRLSDALILMQSKIPDEFQRTTRSLQDIAKWKATEFRFFLLYSGPVLLKAVLSTQLYRHFMLLHSACRILCSADLALQYNTEANKFLINFSKIAAELYGEQCLVINMHNLIHLADDVIHQNCSLSFLTAFPFESMLGTIKKMVRSGHRPLAQICRQLSVSIDTDYEKVLFPPDLTILGKTRLNIDGSLKIKKLRYKEFVIASSSPNNAVLFGDGEIFEITDIYQPAQSNRIKLRGNILRITKSIFTYPCDSEIFKMWQVKRTSKIKTRSLTSIDVKLVMFCTTIERQEKMYVIPLLH